MRTIGFRNTSEANGYLILLFWPPIGGITLAMSRRLGTFLLGGGGGPMC